MKTARLTLARSQIRVLLLEGIHERAEATFQDCGYTRVQRESGALSRADLQELISNVHLVGIRSRTTLDADVLSHARKLIAIGCYCIGTNQVDLRHASQMGVPVFNAPHSNTRSVAELVIGLAVMLFRDTFRKSTLVHAGGWPKSAEGSHELRGKTIGIVGYGHIGSQVSVLAEAMGMQVVFHDIRPILALGNAKPRDVLPEVLGEADLVTLHVPDTEETRGLIGAAEFAQMKPGSHLITPSVHSANLDAMPRKPATTSQKAAPGPPMETATATCATFPTPTVPDTAVVSAWKCETSPGPSGGSS